MKQKDVEEEAVKIEKLWDVVQRYFEFVVQDGVFTIGIDRTGIYVFTRNQSPSVVERGVQEIKEDLDLKDSDVVLVVVGQQCGDFECVTDEDVPGKILGLTSQRAFIFTEQEVSEILECFGFEKEEIVPEPEKEKVDPDLDPNSITDTKHVLASSQFTILLFPFFGLFLLYVNISWWLPFIPFVLGFFMADRLARVTKSHMCFVIEMLCAFGMILTLVIFILGDYQTLLGYVNKFKYFEEHINEYLLR
jgi:uncharacterized membrane protein